MNEKVIISARIYYYMVQYHRAIVRWIVVCKLPNWEGRQRDGNGIADLGRVVHGTFGQVGRSPRRSNATAQRSMHRKLSSELRGRQGSPEGHWGPWPLGVSTSILQQWAFQ